MGAATEAKSTGQIKEIFGGRVESFQKPPRDVQARGRKPGQVTDAFSIPYMLTNAIVQADGKITREIAMESLLEWGDTEYFEPFAGMTTRKAIIEMNRQKKMNTWDYIGHLGNKLFKGHYYALSSNGAAVKAYPAGLFSNGNVDKAIENAVEIAISSHDDPWSVSGACAIAAAICEAMKYDATVYNIVQAAKYGCREGEALARKRTDIHVYPGPSVAKRLDMAIDIALHTSDDKNPIDELRDRIGSGPAIAETVPTAIGIFIAEHGDSMKCICDGVNIGDETSAIASIVGALCGTFRGSRSFPEDYLDFLNEQNGFDLELQAGAVLSACENLS